MRKNCLVWSKKKSWSSVQNMVMTDVLPSDTMSMTSPWKIWSRWQIQSLPWQNLVISNVWVRITSVHSIVAAVVSKVWRRSMTIISRSCLWQLPTIIWCSLPIPEKYTVWRLTRFRRQAERPAELLLSTCCSWHRVRRSQLLFRSRSTKRAGICLWQPRTVLLRKHQSPIMQMSERQVWQRLRYEKMMNWSRLNLPMIHRIFSLWQNTVSVSVSMRLM